MLKLSQIFQQLTYFNGIRTPSGDLPNFQANQKFVLALLRKRARIATKSSAMDLDLAHNAAGQARSRLWKDQAVLAKSG
jgi:hypothetical protein